MCRLAAAGAGNDRDTSLPGGAGGDAGDNAAAAPFPRSEGAGEEGRGDGVVGAEDTDDSLGTNSTARVYEVASEYLEGGSSAAAIATLMPSESEGELPFIR